MDKLNFLINYLLKENHDINLDEIPEDENERKNIFRSLCNIRNADYVSDKFIKLQNEYLTQEINSKKITDIKNINPINKTIKEFKIQNADKICLWKGDITTLRIEAIVNAANSRGLGCFIPCHKCIDNQIHTFAGVQLRLECNEIMKEKNYYLPTGKAIITKGYNLPSKHVIHTVGPIVYGEVTKKEENDLMNSYTNCLNLAKENGIRSIAFPCISTGEFRFPKELAVKHAFAAIQSFLEKNKDSFDKIVFNVFSEEDYQIYEKFIKQNHTNKKINR